MSISVLLILYLICNSESAKILGIFPNAGYSQYILGSALMKTLAERGHEVTVVSPFSLKDSVHNYKNVITKFETGNDSLYDLEQLDVFSNVMIMYNDFGLTLTEGTLASPEVQDLLRSDSTFDLVICEQFANEAHMGFAYHYKSPLILFSSLGACEWTNPLVGNPAPFSHVPMIFSGYTDKMNFWQRLRNSAASLFDLVYRNLIIFPRQNQILQKYFPGAPDLTDLMYNASLILLNSNPAMNAPVTHVPNMIEIGGFHVQPKKLSVELQGFLDGAKDGAIFFSMGSNLRSSELSKDKLGAILDVFSELKQRVLWKWEDENLPGKPHNVKVGKWLPQQDILAHPNVRAFISHGGLLSTTETVFNGVPMIGIPIYCDQKMNIQTAVNNGYALMVPFQELTVENLRWALNEILTNSSYRDAAQQRSKILKDQPLQPKDTAVFWIEYVLRHQGAPHLMTSAIKLTWYQYYLLDVMGFVILFVLLTFLLLKITALKLLKTTQGQKKILKKKEH